MQEKPTRDDTYGLVEEYLIWHPMSSKEIKIQTPFQYFILEIWNGKIEHHQWFSNIHGTKERTPLQFNIRKRDPKDGDSEGKKCVFYKIAGYYLRIL